MILQYTEKCGLRVTLCNLDSMLYAVCIIPDKEMCLDNTMFYIHYST